MVSLLGCGAQPATEERKPEPTPAAEMVGSLTPAIVRVATVQTLDPEVMAAAEAGVDGVLTVDLPPEEADELIAALHAQNLDEIFLRGKQYLYCLAKP